jgi:hypothetical protein
MQWYKRDSQQSTGKRHQQITHNAAVEERELQQAAEERGLWQIVAGGQAHKGLPSTV